MKEEAKRTALGGSVELVGFGEDRSFVPSSRFAELAWFLKGLLGTVFHIRRYDVREFFGHQNREGFLIGLYLGGDALRYSVSGPSRVWETQPRMYDYRLDSETSTATMTPVEGMKVFSFWRDSLSAATEDTREVLSAGCTFYRYDGMKIAELPSFSTLEELIMKLRLRGDWTC